MTEQKVTLIADGTDPRVRSDITEVEYELSRLRIASTLHVCEARGEASEITTDLLRAGDRFIGAVGGDSHVADVIEGMFEDGSPIAHEALLGIVPAGAGSDLLRTFSMPTDTRGACRYLASETTYPLDVMKVTLTDQAVRSIRMVATVAQMGFGAGFSARLGSDPSGSRQLVAYWMELAKARPVTVRIEADRSRFEGKAFDVVVANSQHARGLRVSPRSYPGDGVLESTAFTGPRSDALTLLPKILRNGDHIPHRNIAEQRAKIRIAVDSDRPLRVVADGRVIGTTPATFQIVPRALLLKA
jgi:diacylglycerol kinase (ATP)